MPHETTASILIGPVFSYMGGAGSMLANTLLVLDEGSGANWRIVDLDGRRSPVLAAPRAPRNLLAHGLLGYLASRPNADALLTSTDLRALATHSGHGHYRTEVPNAALERIVEALGDSVAIVVTVLAGSTVRPREIAQLRHLGLRIEQTLSTRPLRSTGCANIPSTSVPMGPDRSMESGPCRSCN